MLTELIKVKEKRSVQLFFRGIFSLVTFVHDFDSIWKTNLDRNKKSIFFINTSESSEQVGHWLTLLVDGALIYFIDSFALSPSTYSFELHLKLNRMIGNNGDIKQLPYRLQSETSSVCGLYALFFALKFAQATTEDSFGKSLQVDNFEADYPLFKPRGEEQSNDQHILSYFQRRWNLKDRDSVLCTKRAGASKRCFTLHDFMGTPLETD